MARRDEGDRALGRHALLLASLIFLLAALPIAQILIGDTPRFPILLALVLVAAILVNSYQRWVFIAALAVGLAAIGGTLVTIVSDDAAIRIASHILSLGLLSFTTLILLNSLLRTDIVSHDTIVGGVCVYLLIGLCYAVVFIMLVDFQPGAIEYAGSPIESFANHSSAEATALLYFSFVTLATLGYGDVRPVTELAQMLSVSEALVGQLYLTIFVARLVGLYIGHRRSL